MTDPEMLDTDAYHYMFDEFNKAIDKGPTYICNICWKCEYKTNTLTLNPEKYAEHDTMFSKCTTDNKSHGDLKYICKMCDRALTKGKMPVQAQANNMHLNEMFNEINDLTPLEVALVSQIIPFMHITYKHAGEQDKLKGRVVLVPSDLTKIQKQLPRTCSDAQIICLSLKKRLSDPDRKEKYKTYIRPAAVNAALTKLVEINGFYKDIQISQSWEQISQQSDPDLCNSLLNTMTDNIPEDDDKEHLETNICDDEGEIDEAENHNKAQVNFPTVIHKIYGQTLKPGEVLNLAPGEGNIPVSTYSEPDWEPLAFIKQYPQGKFHFNTVREVKITPSKYINARLKCYDPRFATDPQYIFQCKHWLEREIIKSTINFNEMKRRHDPLTAGDIKNNTTFKSMISEHEMYASFKSIRGTPQYFHDMMLDVLAKIRKFGPPTFFITFSAAEFHWTDIIKIVARQYGEELSDESIRTMSRSQKVKYLKRNPVTVAKQIDYRFNQLFKKCLFSGMHPVGQIINIDDRREYQQRGTQHVHAIIHVENAPKLDIDNDDVVVKFIDKYITCSIPDSNSRQELFQLVNKVQKHHHTFTCRKKKALGKDECRLGSPWLPTDETIIVRTERNTQKLKKAKSCIRKIREMIKTLDDIENLTFSEFLEHAGLEKEDYEINLKQSHNKYAILYKRKPHESLIAPYNTVLLNTWGANMNIQFVTGMYGVVAYLTSYLCKPERAMSEFMKAACEESESLTMREKLNKIGNIFQEKREVSLHEAIAFLISLAYRHSNIDVQYIPTGLRRNITRMLKPDLRHRIYDPDSTDIFVPNILDKYANRPDSLEQDCLADFASLYRNVSKQNPKVEGNESIESYIEPVSDYIHTPDSNEIIVLRNDMGKMKKRSRPCVIRWHNVSRMKNEEDYCMKMLQLFLPWRNENELKHQDDTYTSKYNEVEGDIRHIIEKHQQFEELDPDQLDNQSDTESNENEFSDESDNEYIALRPELLEINSEPMITINSTTQSRITLRTQYTTEQFYEICYQLNKKQKMLFNAIAKYVQKVKLQSEEPDPFYIFLSGGGGVGKSFLIGAISEYALRYLIWTGANHEQKPSIIRTASTGVAASNICGTTLHSAFSLPIFNNKINRILKQGDKKLVELQAKYKEYLKIVIVDEISMVGLQEWNTFENTLKLIKEIDDKPFGGVSILASGDLFQLPPVASGPIYSTITQRLECLSQSIWQKEFELHELTEIVRQAEDPEFANILNRVREGKQTPTDCQSLEQLNYTDVSNWPYEPIKLYSTNKPALEANNETVNKLPATKYTIMAKDKPNDLDDSISISNTGNLPHTLRICEKARFMLTVNLDTEDHLVNGSIGTIEAIHIRSRYPLRGGIIFIQFDNPKAGNARKIRNLHPQCVPIEPITQSFRYKGVNYNRKQFPGILASAITIHKSQGSTFQYMMGYLESGKGKTVKRPGMMYTLLSRNKTRSGIKLDGFTSDMIVTNESALVEMKRMREEKIFHFKHPISFIQSPILLLLNMRSWITHIAHHFADQFYLDTCSILCFTETNVKRINEISRISSFHTDWKDHHQVTEHGLAICYNKNNMILIQILTIDCNLEATACIFKNCQSQEEFIIFLIYRKNGTSILTFFTELYTQLSTFASHNLRIILLGDFNLDPSKYTNNSPYSQIEKDFNLHMQSEFPTQIHGGMLDIIFDSDSQSCTLEWLPTPFSDHFIIFYGL